MGKRGPKPSVSDQQKIIALKKFDIFDTSHKVKKESDPVWQQVCDFINSEYINDPAKYMKPRNIQNYVSQNRNGVIFHLQQTNVNLRERLKVNCENKTKLKDSTKENVKTRVDEEKDLLRLQSNVMYKPTIKEVNTFPFTVTHWTMEAIDFASKTMTQNNIFIFGCVGSFCENFNFPDGEQSEVINLFSFGTKINDEFISICQLSTEENSVTIFKRFFNEIVTADAPIPEKLVVDYKYNHYISANCYLTGNEVDLLPKCIIYTDIRLLILSILNWDSMCSVSLTSVKYFYIYCIVLLSCQKTLHHFEAILEKVFAIALSEFQNKTTRDFFEGLMFEMKKLKIDTIYNQQNIEIMKDEYQNILDPDSFSKIDYDKCPQILNYIAKIVVKAKQCVATTGMECERNAFYSEKICKNVMKCCVEFVLWTKLMCKGDESTENLSLFEDCLKSYKNDFKCYLFQDISSIPSVVTYLMKNIEYTENKLENIKNSIQLSNQKIVNNNTELEYLFHNENWKGRNQVDSDYDSSYDSEKSSSSDEELDFSINDFQGQDITSLIDSVLEELSVEESESKMCDADMSIISDAKSTSAINKAKPNCENNIKRGAYLKACPEIDLLNQKPTVRTTKRKIIKNYNLLKPRSLGKKKVYVTTSSFIDSIIEIMVSTYHSIRRFKKSIDDFCDTLTKTKQDFLNLFKEYIKTFNMTTFYAARCKLCIDVCEVKNDKLRWSKSIGEFLECALYSNIFTKYKCQNCMSSSFQHCNNLTKLSLENITSKELSNIIHHHLTTVEKNICSCSKPNVVCEYFIKDFFCIDIEAEPTNCSTIKLEELVPLLNIANEKFILSGVIAYEAPIGNKVLRHYIAYVRSLTGSWTKYNNTNTESSKPEKVKENGSINVALLLYVKYDTIDNSRTEKNDCHVAAEVNNEKISVVSNQITSEEVPELQITTISDINEIDSFKINEIEAQSSFVDEIDLQNLIVNSVDIDSSIVTENLDESVDVSFTKRCWSNNESSIESSPGIHHYINNLHNWRNLIQNGSILPPIEFSKQKFKLTNTCPIDSIIEVFTAAHCFQQSFQRRIFEITLSETNNEVFEIVQQYIYSKSRNLYYEKRLQYCNSRTDLYKQEEHKQYILIDCRDNVVRLFESVMENEYCIEKSITCICNYTNTQKYKIQSININFPIEDNAIKELENYLTGHFSKQTKNCYKCKENAQLTYKIMTYFCVELGTNFLFHKNVQCNLNSIPIKLNLCKEVYHLVGVISFDLPNNVNDGLLHYYSFIKLPNDEWEERNNLKQVIMQHSKYSRIKIRPALLFYVRRRVSKSDPLLF